MKAFELQERVTSEVRNESASLVWHWKIWKK